MSLDLRADGRAVTFPVRVVPRAPETALAGVREGALVVRLAAPPVEGKANAALLAFLASVLGVPKARVALRAGEKSRAKLVSVAGVDPSRALELLIGKDSP